MPEVAIVDSLAQVDRRDWEAVFPHEVEDYDYLSAVEAAALPGFAWRYVLVSEAGVLRAAAPAFVADYKLDTTLPKGGRQLVGALRRVTPGLMRLRLACLGSPCTETALVGVARDAAPGERRRLMTSLIGGLEQVARAEDCSLIGLKDVIDHDDVLASAAREAGYAPVGGLPSAELAIRFPSIEAYLGSLGAGTRKDMRRKLRLRSGVRVEVRSDISDVLDRLMDLYRQTLDRAEMSFEELTPAFFAGACERMAGHALFVLYFDQDELIAFNLLLCDGSRLLDKFFCMEEDRGRALNLYFLSWFENVDLCLARGLTCYRAGQAAYADKLRLGCSLTPTWNFFRHRNPVLNGALRLVSPMFSAAPQPKAAT